MTGGFLLNNNDDGNTIIVLPIMISGFCSLTSERNFEILLILTKFIDHFVVFDVTFLFFFFIIQWHKLLQITFIFKCN